MFVCWQVTLLDGGNGIVQAQILTWLSVRSNAEQLFTAFLKLVSRFGDALSMAEMVREGMRNRKTRSGRYGL